MIRISVAVSGDFEGIRGEAEQRVRAGFARAVGAAEAQARASAPRRTGKLRDAIRAYLTGAMNAALVSAAPYSSYLHDGTGLYGPHNVPIIIRPVGKKALWWKGAPHPVKGVAIKGIRPGRFLRDAVRDSLLERAFDEGFEKGE